MEPAVPSRRLKYIVRVCVFTPIVVLAASWWHPWPRHGLDRVRHAVHWDPECGGVKVSTWAIYWPHAQRLARLECEDVGPAPPVVWYARFPDQAALRTDLRRTPPSAAACVTGDEVVVDGLGGGFPATCRRLGGRYWSAGA